ncbi:MAG: hypothetical protein JXR96_11130 [Deltaproteobacteria bacterium]|nr:hypothetical protein [Deltaproteobacteria bacterium]
MRWMTLVCLPCLLLCTPRPLHADPPTISRSRGVAGGVVVLWPRIVPGSASAESRDIARALQARLRALVARELPGRPIDSRPEPERVCPQAGCEAFSAGALLIRRGQGCAVVALLSPPGPSAARLVRWAGELRLKQQSVAFRKPPESHVTVTDFASCAELASELDANAERVERALRMLTSPAPGEKAGQGQR